MDRLVDEAIVIRDTLSFYESEGITGQLVAVRLAGNAYCADELLIRVDKKMLVDRDGQNRYCVRTQFYQYHAWLRSRPDRPRRDLIRIDHAHDEELLHRHVFDAEGQELGRTPLDRHAMPTLDEFIRMAHQLANRS